VNRKYMATGPEAEFQPGSRGRVLRNRLGITRVRDMNEAESQALLIAQEAASTTSAPNTASPPRTSAISTVSGSVPSTNGQATTAA
jgi:hypothetical protein